jgi:DNA invertase Pin-like site-specific DNA recombinase
MDIDGKEADMECMDIYIRVSRVGDRKGSSYRSPKQQEESCRGWAEQNGIEVGKVVTEENISGGKRAQDRKLEELLRRAEAGVSGGIIVYRINRFGRRMRDTVAAVGRLRDAGKRLVSVDDGYDTDQPSGQILLGVYAGIAEQQLDERTTNWDTTIQEAVAEGKHIACRAPIGYLRRDEVDPVYDAKGKLERDARLIEDPLAARVVREAFEMRRRGDSLGTIAGWMGEQLDRRFSKNGVSAIFANTAYMGIARGPKSASNPGAHTAIVEPELWKAVQGMKGKYHPRNGSMAAQSVLAGIAHCAACGKRMQVTGRTKPDGSRLAMYVCRHPDCEDQAIIDVAKLDNYVLGIVQDDPSGPAAGLSAGEERFIDAREALKTAEAELERFQDPTLSTELGVDIWRRGLALASKRINDARQTMWDLQDYDLLDDAEIVELDGRKILYQPWGEDKDADRRTLRRCIGTLTVARSDPKRRRWQPLDERVSLTWADGSLPQVA